MYYLKRWLIWISRWRHCRGFGVQSPSDYSFIRYVINEHYPYYAYGDLRNEMPAVSRLKRKRAELLFRIANWKQPEYVTLLTDDEVYRRYITRGCRKSAIYNELPDSESLIVTSALSLDDDTLSILLDRLQRGSVIILDDMDSETGRSVWNRIAGDSRATITFDLYYMGIVMNIERRYKHNYIVNF